MHPFKVVYLESTFLKKKMFNVEGRIDGLTMAKELEALLIEQETKGYDLISIVPLNGNAMQGIGPAVPASPGILVTFKKRVMT